MFQGLQNRAIRELKIEANFRNNKSGRREGLQIGAV